jgi:hypothetical protein
MLSLLGWLTASILLVNILLIPRKLHVWCGMPFKEQSGAARSHSSHLPVAVLQVQA